MHSARVPESTRQASTEAEADRRATVRRRNFPHVTMFRAEGDRPPLVFVAGLEGHPFVFRELVQAFDDRQPVIGLQLIGADVEEELDVHTVEDMAAVLEPQVAGVCPEGPLVVGGFSMGVLVAFELVRRLRSRGRDVPFLISFDGCAPRFYRQRIPLLRRGIAHANAFWKAPAAYLTARTENISRRLSSYVGQDWRFMDAPDLGDPERRARLMQMMVLWERASERYDPADFLPLPMLLVRTTENFLPLGVENESELGWGACVSGRVSVIFVPGSHATFLKSVENRRVVAEAISRHLSEAVR